MGKAMMGTGEAEGARRAIDAAEAAISNPLLDEVSLKGARAMLINITAGMDIALFEVDEAVNRVRAEVDPDANVIFGSTFDPTMEGRLRVSVVATGIDAQNSIQAPPARQPTLDVIRGGVDMSPARKSQSGGFAPALSAVAQSWPTAGTSFGALGGAAVSAARQIEPASFEAAPEVALEMSPISVAPVAEPQETIRVVEPTPKPFARAQQQEAEESASDPARAAESEPGSQTLSAPSMPPLSAQPGSKNAPQPAAPEKKRSYSLFERATGAARRAEQANAAAAAQAAPMRAAPSFGPQVTARPQPQDHGAAVGQPRLGIDGPARPKIASPDDDMLEIPAFLRRQAN
jgi:cell division protein FtsZ